VAKINTCVLRHIGYDLAPAALLQGSDARLIRRGYIASTPRSSTRDGEQIAAADAASS
jgi:hypothetical protein